MEEHQQLLNTTLILQPYLQAANESAHSDFTTVRSLVLRFLSNGDVFAGYDQIKLLLLAGGALKKAPSMEAQKFIQTLDLFSYGTYMDYILHKENYLPLTDTHIFKLRQLTLLSLVEKICYDASTNRLLYTSIQQELQLDSSRAVEEIVISCLYARVLRGKLCQKTGSFLIDVRTGPPCCSRDVRDVAPLLDALIQLQERVTRAQHNIVDHKSQVSQLLEQQQQYVAETKKKADASDGPDDMEGASGRSARRQKRSRGGLGGILPSFQF